MPTKWIFKDQLGRNVILENKPFRIVSLVPSQTELLFDLGLDDRIAGVTKFCVHPADKVGNILKVGGTKKLDIQKIHDLHPDLIIANKEENERSQIEELMKHYPVWVSDINDLKSALDMISGIGDITGSLEKAAVIREKIVTMFDALTPLVTKSVLYFIWRRPYMVAGKGTFIDDMLCRCGLENSVKSNRYPELNIKEIINLNPEVVLLSSEPYPFKEKHLGELRNYLPHAKIYLVDGEMFSWYGSRLLRAIPYFASLLNTIPI